MLFFGKLLGTATKELAAQKLQLLEMLDRFVLVLDALGALPLELGIQVRKLFVVLPDDSSNELLQLLDARGHFSQFRVHPTKIAWRGAAVGRFLHDRAIGETLMRVPEIDSP